MALAPSFLSDKTAVWVLDGLVSRAKHTPEQTAFIFVDERDFSEQVVSYRALYLRAQAVSLALHDAGVAPGQAAVIIAAPGYDYVVSLVGCLLAGCVAVPAYPPRNTAQSQRIEGVIQDACASVVITQANWRPRLAEMPSLQAGRVHAIEVDGLPAQTTVLDLFHPTDPSSLAVLQYTSGSTGTPKGVMLTHASLLHNVQSMVQTFACHAQHTGVTWLPPYHDMGLMGGLFLPLLSGLVGVAMSPAVFAQRPVRWLEAMSRHGAVITGAPNFAYELCIERITDEQLVGIDLSQWRFALNGAEFVRAGTLQRFADRFGPYGFRAEAFFPCYGLAEATLYVTGGHWQGMAAATGADDADLALPVAVGQSLPDQHVVVVDPVSAQVLPDGQEGEIWVSGPSMAKGYWQRPQQTEEVFHAVLLTAHDGLPSGPYLRTGDLAVRRAGELFVTGRIKDMINVSGRKYYPQDIELCAQRAHAAMRMASGAAFAVTDAQRELTVLVQEVEPRFKGDLQEVMRTVQQAVVQALDVGLDVICLVAAGAVEKTSSGKVRRSTTRQAYVDGQLKVLAVGGRAAQLPLNTSSESAEITEADTLLSALSRVLAVPVAQVPLQAPLIELGLDSLGLMQLQPCLDALGLQHLPLSDIYSRSVQALLDEAQVHTPASSTSAKVPAASDKPFALTPLQAAYWVGRQSGNNAVSAHVYADYDVSDVDVDRLLHAWQSLVALHPMLRAVVRADGMQEVLSVATARERWGDTHQRLDWRSHTAATAQQAFEDLRERMSHEVLSAEHGPLHHVVCTTLPNGRTTLHLSMDMLVADAASMVQIMADWATLYRGEHLTPPALTFQQCLAWQIASDGSASADRAEKDRQYWLDQLMQMPGGPELPLAVVPQALPRIRFARQQATVPAAQWQAIKARARQWGVTPSMLLLATYARALSTWSKHPAFTVMLTHFNRPAALSPAVDRVVGDFTAALPVACAVTASLRDTAQAVQQRFLSAYEHRSFSGADVQREHVRMHGTDALPLSACVFTSLLQDIHAVDWLGQPQYMISQTPQVWIDHQVFERQGDLVLVFDTVQGLFKPHVLEGLFASYQRLLSDVLTVGLSEDVNDQSELPAAWLATVTREHVPAVTPPQAVQTLPGLFDVQAKALPHNVALQSPYMQLTYAQLDAASAQLSKRLLQAGARPETLVAIVMHKGWEQVLAALAVVRAGAAYLPIDAALPPARITHLLSRGEVSLVLTQVAVKELLTWPEHVQAWALSEDDTQVSASDDALSIRLPAVESQQLAYVIFTSGSTGEPKGVAIEHGAVVNTLLDINQRLSVTANDRILAISSLSFDLSVYDIFGALAAGASVVVPEGEWLRDPPRLRAYAEETGITIWNSVPALMHLVAEHAHMNGEALPQQLRWIMMSGDWIPVTLPALIQTLHPRVQVLSLGGATEASIWSIGYCIEHVDAQWKSIPYGTALHQQTMWVLDAQWHVRAPFVPGEIFIGGVGLAREYWRAPELTAERFVTHPVTGERLYRTGDLGCYLPDGNIEFLGRMDHQVKVAGYRVELGEIEACLLKHPSLAHAVVVLQPLRGGQRLVAYVVPHGGQTVDVPSLREWVVQHLPAYMCPAHIVALAALPLSSNGKVDRSALPAVGEDDRSLVADEKPSDAQTSTTQIEQQILTIVATTLGMEKLASTDNFFDLGAHSIDLMRAANVLEKAFGRRPSLSHLFELATVQALTRFYADHQLPVVAASSSAPNAVNTTVAVQDIPGFAAQQPGLRALPDACVGTPLMLGSESVLDTASAGIISRVQWSACLQGLCDVAAASNMPPLGWRSVQAYVWVQPHQVAGLRGGVYYLHPVQMSLVFLSDRVPAMPSCLPQPALAPAPQQAAMTVALVGKRSATDPVVGQTQGAAVRAVEAGGLAQHLLDCAIGKFGLQAHLLMPVQAQQPLLHQLGLDDADHELCAWVCVNANAATETIHSEQAASTPLRLPMSDAQRRLWLLHQLKPHDAAYNEPVAIELQGALQLDALQAALQALMQRHSALRTTFEMQDGQPVQCIHVHLPVDLEVFQSLDAQSVTPMHADIHAWVAQPFDLATQPAIRAAVWQTPNTQSNQAKHCLVVTLHHIVCDGWSMAVLLRDLVVAYSAQTQGHAPAWQPLAYQYADVVEWDAKPPLLMDAVADTQADLAYWQQTLAGPLPVLELPTDHQRPAELGDQAVVASVQVPAELARRLHQLARQQGVTLYMLLMTAYQVWLQRMSGQNDVCVGTPLAHREQSESEGVVGFLVNTVVIRGQWSVDAAFDACLAQIKQQCLHAQAHQRMPFEQVVQAVQAVRDPSRGTLFQTLFALQNVPADADVLAGLPQGLSARLLPLDLERAKFDLALEVHESALAMDCRFIAHADLFVQPTVARWAQHWLALLTDVVDRPHACVSELRLLTDAQHAQCAPDWNEQQAQLSADASILQRLQHWVQWQPDALAVVFARPQADVAEGESAVQSDATYALTYAQLDALSTQWAWVLQQAGVGRKAGKSSSQTDLVGIYLPRSVDMIVAVWATWKAGAAFVPLDPAYPSSRLADMVQDAGLCWAFTHIGMTDALRDLSDAVAIEPICMDVATSVNDAAHVSAVHAAPPWPVQPNDLAYVIFTSGSTGRPKGVALEHKGLVHLVDAQCQCLNINQQHRVLQLSSLSFDASVWDIVMAHAHGASLHVVGVDTVLSPVAMARTVREQGITTITMPPSLLAWMPQEDFAKVHTIIVAGEACPAELAAKWAPGRCFVNAYGPTEATVCATMHVMQVPDGATLNDAHLPPSIGLPLPHIYLRVLDAQGQPVPVGVPGELYIGGASLARSYWGRPDLTAERFVPDHTTQASAKTSARLYRTGDRVRWRPDGQLDFLGRMDSQVKLRGFRIELGEIEAALLAGDGVREAAVLLHTPNGSSVDTQAVLVAYVSLHSGDAVSAPHTIKARLSQRLPAYMVPSHVMVLDTLPWTPNGKVDRQKLPAPHALQIAASTRYMAPRDPLELQVLYMWEDILGHGGFGIFDSFFDVGGSSLAAIRLIGSIQTTFGVQVPVSALVGSPTIEAVAAIIRQGVKPSGSDVLVPIRSQGTRTPIFFVHAAGGTVMSYYELAKYMSLDRPVYGLQAQGIEAGAEPFEHLSDMAAHYVDTIRGVQPEGPYLLAGWSMGGNIVFEMARQLLQAGQSVAFLGMLDASADAFNNEMPPRDDISIIVEMFRNEMPVDEAVLRQLPADTLLEQAVVAANDLKWLPPGFTVEQARRILNVYRLSERAVRKHVCERINMGLTLFRSTELLPDEVPEPPDRGWTPWVDGPITIIDTPGNHINMVMHPHSEVLGRLLDEALAPF